MNWSKKEQLANLIYLVFIYQKQGYSFLQENADVKVGEIRSTTVSETKRNDTHPQKNIPQRHGY